MDARTQLKVDVVNKVLQGKATTMNTALLLGRSVLSDFFRSQQRLSA